MAILRHVKQRLLLTGLLFGVVASSPRSADAQDQVAGQDLITSQGQGETRVRPDSLRTSVGVELQATTLEKARSEANTRMQRVIQALTALRIPGAALQTQTLQFSPVYSEREELNKPRKITGYSVTHRLSVTVLGATPNELGEHASRIIDTAIKNGANTVNDVDFFLRDTSAAQSLALAAAVQNAGQNARAMAEAAKVRITRVYSLEGAAESVFGPTYYRASAALAATPIEAGEITVSSRVTARFSFSK